MLLNERERKNMRKIVLFLRICQLAGTLSAQHDKEIYIFITNDMHSRVEPFSPEYADTMLAGKGG